MKAALLVLLLAACSSTPDRPTMYRNLGWAKMSAQQASAECQYEAERFTPNPNYNPIVQGMQMDEQFPRCMRSKGWQEQ